MLSRDFREFVESLNANEVRYLVVGGYAVALHGYPRYTKDISIWTERSPKNASRIMDALGDFGFGSMELAADDFLEKDQIIQLGYTPNRIDIITSLEGVEFDESYESRVEVDIGGVRVDFIGIQHLKANKRATGRAQDIADAEHLET